MNEKHDNLGRFASHGGAGSGKVSVKNEGKGPVGNSGGSRVGEIVNVDGTDYECIEYHEDVKRGLWRATKPISEGGTLHSHQRFSDSQIEDCPVVSKKTKGVSETGKVSVKKPAVKDATVKVSTPAGVVSVKKSMLSDTQQSSTVMTSRQKARQGMVAEYTPAGVVWMKKK